MPIYIETPEFRRQRQPQNRSWQDVSAMILARLRELPIILPCKACFGEHACADPELIVRCGCGAVTRYDHIALFHGWSSLAWTMLQAERRGNVCGESTPLMATKWVGRLIGETTNGQPAFNSRTTLWRLRLR